MRSTPSLPRMAAYLTLVLFALPARAQQPSTYPDPLLKSVFPPGGTLGTEVEVTVDGAYLDEASELYFSTPGLKAERLPDPPTDPKKKDAPPPPARFKVAIAENVPPGTHDVRVIGKWGISNPRTFVVGSQPELIEKEPNSDVPEAQELPFETTMNGVISEKTDVDYYVFQGRAKQRVVVHCAASEVDSRLNSYLQVFTENGRKLGGNRAYNDGDAVLSCILPEDGKYFLRICEFAYIGGSPEHLYRLSVSTAPWIDAVYPPVLAAGKDSTVTVFGRNLPGGEPVPGIPGRQQMKATIHAPAAPSPFPGYSLPRMSMVDGFPYRLSGSNPVFLGLISGTVALDNGDNDEEAQPVSLPGEICGRFERRGDRDVYSFEAKKGDTLIAEGYSDRLGSAADLYFILWRADTDAVVGEFDTHPDVPARTDRFFTYTDDPMARVVIPADGTYRLSVGNRNPSTVASVRDFYRVCLRREQPDFRLVLVGNHDGGSGLTLHRGNSQAIQVVCFRKDGFDGEIMIAAEGLPPGVTCEPQILGPKAQQGALVLKAAKDARDWAGEYRVTGTASVDGKKVVRSARPGCLVFPATGNNAAVSRLARSLCLAVRDPGPFGLSVSEKELAIPVGGTKTVKVKIERRREDMKDPVSVTLAAGPVQSNGQMIRLGQVNISPEKEGDIRITLPSNTPPGRYTLVFRGSGKYSIDDPQTKRKKSIQYAAVSAPILATVYSTACELSFGKDPILVPVGGEAAVLVKITRLHGYTGTLSLEVVTPSSAGVTASNVTVPANATEATLVLKAKSNAKPARDIEFVVRTTARVENTTLRDESKFAVTVTPAGETAVPENVKTLTLLEASATGWRYTATVKGKEWAAPDFEDKDWAQVKAPLGYGELEIASRKGTEIRDKGQPVFARRVFEVTADVLARKGASFKLRVASDNSAVVYLNGKPADEDSGDHEFNYWNREVTISPQLLKAGKNVIAVRVDNTAGSSDLYFDAAVEALLPLTP